MSGFDSYRGGKPAREKSCFRCGKNDLNAGSVMLQMREKTSGRGSDKTLASFTRAMCEDCTVATYEELLRAFELKARHRQ